MRHSLCKTETYHPSSLVVTLLLPLWKNTKDFCWHSSRERSTQSSLKTTSTSEVPSIRAVGTEISQVSLTQEMILQGAFVNWGGNSQGGRYIWLICPFLHNMKYPFNCTEGRKREESLGSSLCCDFSGEASLGVNCSTGSAETLEVCQPGHPFLSWLVWELGWELIVFTLSNLCSFRKKGCQVPREEERGKKANETGDMSKPSPAALSPCSSGRKKTRLKHVLCFQIPGLQRMYYDTHFKIWLHLESIFVR